MQEGDRSPSEGHSSTREYFLMQNISKVNSVNDEVSVDYMNKLMFSDRIYENPQVVDR